MTSMHAAQGGTKAFLDSFSFALRHELKDSGVSVTCLMPGATETEFFERAEMQDTKLGHSDKDDAADVAVVQPGGPMPVVDTPTTADPRGVTPICTAEPPCPLHDTTLSAVLGEGRPVALLIATPAFCQIAICGPVLDILLEAAPAHPDVRFLHAEVYADPATDLTTYAPVVGELGLHFEPCLVLVGSDGVVAERLDTIYDRSELDERLGALR